MNIDINISGLVTIAIIFEWFVRIAAFFIVPRNRKPSSATAWLMLIMLFPTLGILLFLLIGSPKLSKRRRAKQRTMDSFIADARKILNKDKQFKDMVDPKLDDRYLPFAALNKNLSGLPAFSGNSVELIPEYNDVISSIVDDINSAKFFVHIEFFILAMDGTTEDLFEAMESAISREVKVRVLFDTMGSRRYPNYKLMKKRLTQIGVDWRPMLPLRLPGPNFTRPDLRNHRKIIVIDGEIGYTGSLNLITRNYHRKDELYYDEMVAKIMGPAVLQMEAVFITDWYSETDELLTTITAPELRTMPKKYGEVDAQILPSGPGFDNENNLKLFTGLIHAAKEKVVITNPYFVPDDALMTAITSAAQRGVDVIMINSEVIDQWMVAHAQRSYYEELLKAGVKIYWYKRPILLHSKHITIDDDIAVIGSSNLDIRSFQLDLEVTLVLYDKTVVTDLRKIEGIYLSKSSQIMLDEWLARPMKLKLYDNIARLTAALQ